ncbi:hypothetical protein Dsin_008269 [Dipteronia sinensis]|uniref:Uncharacterized protein n=1 Tax=Dipteronia sinensis TaxID=43782 RepID=A0AAE0EAS5_9ROSI|nr:hypothetical protein Dsin_008269 [Dipteronia sinensis]
MARRRYNKLKGLKGDDGIWKNDKASMKFIANSYFKNPFSARPISLNYVSLPCLFPVLEESVIVDLNKEVSEVEVRANLFRIGGLKAHGLDGFPAAFFQNQWGYL